MHSPRGSLDGGKAVTAAYLCLLSIAIIRIFRYALGEKQQVGREGDFLFYRLHTIHRRQTEAAAPIERETCWGTARQEGAFPTIRERAYFRL